MKEEQQFKDEISISNGRSPKHIFSIEKEEEAAVEGRVHSGRTGEDDEEEEEDGRLVIDEDPQTVSH